MRFVARRRELTTLVAALASAVPVVVGRHAAGAMAAPTAGGGADVSADHLRCASLVDPIGVGEARPRLTWTLTVPPAAGRRGVLQTAYQVEVASAEPLLADGRADLWDSGKVDTADQAAVYAGRPLASRTSCVWRVRAWDEAGRGGPWSAVGRWEVGLLDAAADWHARWVSPPRVRPAQDLTVVRATFETLSGRPAVRKDVTEVVRRLVRDRSLAFTVSPDALGGDPAENRPKQLRLRYRLGDGRPVDVVRQEKATVDVPGQPVAVLRRPFRVDRPVVRARLYATARGLYAFTVNGRPVTDAVMSPVWTDYAKRCGVQAFDVTPLLRPGANAIAVTVADGFYSGRVANGGFQFWGTRPSVLAQLELTRDDGSVDRVCTDGTWVAHPGPIVATGVMDGEDYDARAELPGGGSAPDLPDDGRWTPADVRADLPPAALSAQPGPLVRPLMTLSPKAVTEPTPGHYVFDLGQNMVGMARIKVSAPAGTTVTVRFAEMLKPADHTVYTANYRDARSTDTYVCRGGGAAEVWQPTFTYHGFRYVELTGLPARPAADAVTGIVEGSDTPSAGTFACSDPDLNRLWSNIRWGQRGNFFGVPTDCPQRDERLGYLGDAQVFAGTAVYNADVAAFFKQWLTDVDDAQRPDGRFSATAPDTDLCQPGTPAWADGGVICPWVAYRTYGDAGELRRHLPAMMRYVDWCRDHSDALIRTRDRGNDFGDWLAIGAKTSKELLATAYFAHSADLVARSARAVGDDVDAAKYADLFAQIAAAFRGRYLAPDGSIVEGTQTGYALALAFDLLPEPDRAAAADRLADDVRAHGDHLTTGFLGVSYLLPALADHGHADVAYRLLRQDTFPSWLFSVRQGATTIWERWDGWTPDKGFQNVGMNSFNHYSLGSCGQWLYEGVAGIGQVPGTVGFGHLLVRPRVGGGLTEARATYDSVRGPIAAAWRASAGRLTLDVTVPPNVTATVHVPTDRPGELTESGRPAAGAAGVVGPVGIEPGAAVVEVGSGTYRFAAPAPTPPPADRH